MGAPRPIVCVGFAEWDSELWTNQQHLMSRLAQDRRVLFVESLGLRRPQLAGRDLRRLVRRLIRGLAGARERSGVLVLSPLVLPLHGSRTVRALNARLLSALVGRAARRAGISRPVLWAYVPQAESLVDTLYPALIVYHCVDDIAAQKGVDADSFRAAESRFVANADLVLTSAEPLARRLEPAARRLVHAPNVADTELFARAREPGPVDPALAALPGPRIVFIGAVVGTKLDVELILEIARRRPQWSIALVGPVGLGDPSTDVSALRVQANVHLLGARPHSALPDVLRGADAAVIPYAINELTRSIFPMKVYEYLAAGVPVVSTSLPSLADVDVDIAVADDADAFVEELEKALDADDTRRGEWTAQARSHSWERRVAQIRTLLEELEPGARTVVAVPHPLTLTSGAGLRTWGVVAALAAHGPVDVVHHDTGHTPDQAYVDAGVRLHPVTGSRGVRRAAAYLRARAQGVPRGFARGVWPELITRVRALDDGRCRVVADGPIAGAALRRLGRGRVVYNSHNVESTFRHAIDDSDSGSMRSLRRFERRLLENAAESWVVSARDEVSAQTLAPLAVLRRVPNVVDVGRVGVTGPSGRPSILFVGDGTYEPNRRGLGLLLGEVMPALWAARPDVHLVVAGRGTTDLTADDVRVDLRGFVPDLDALYTEASCVVVPLTEGGGSPLKFLEALAHGLPVVATPVAAAGLDALRSGQHFLLADARGPALAEAIVAALDPETGRRLGAAGRTAVEEEYSVTALSERFAR